RRVLFRSTSYPGERTAQSVIGERLQSPSLVEVLRPGGAVQHEPGAALTSEQLRQLCHVVGEGVLCGRFWDLDEIRRAHQAGTLHPAQVRFEVAGGLQVVHRGLSTRCCRYGVAVDQLCDLCTPSWTGRGQPA